MSEKTGISWCDSTWNPLRGCSKVSAGCKNCYAEGVAARFSGPGLPYEGTIRDGRWNGEIRFVPEKLSEPLRWKRPRRIFVNSMSDLFHDGVPFEFIAAVFGVMAACPQHTFQVLTKRAARAVRFFAWLSVQNKPDDDWTGGRLECTWQALRIEAETFGDSGPLHTRHAADPVGPWPLPNVHIGVSVENQDTADERIPLLLQCPAAVRWVSYEPALERVDFDNSRDWLTPVITKPADAPRLDWIVVGGESGPNARPFHVQWARSTIAQCKAAGTACFVKQIGSSPCPAFDLGIKDRAGADPSEWPDDLRVQEFPESAR